MIVAGFFGILIFGLQFYGFFFISDIQEAKNAFKALLESANVQSDWTWEQVSQLNLIIDCLFFWVIAN